MHPVDTIDLEYTVSLSCMDPAAHGKGLGEVALALALARASRSDLPAPSQRLATRRRSSRSRSTGRSRFAVGAPRRSRASCPDSGRRPLRRAGTHSSSRRSLSTRSPISVAVTFCSRLFEVRPRRGLLPRATSPCSRAAGSPGAPPLTRRPRACPSPRASSRVALPRWGESTTFSSVGSPLAHGGLELVDVECRARDGARPERLDERDARRPPGRGRC